MAAAAKPSAVSGGAAQHSISIPHYTQLPTTAPSYRAAGAVVPNTQPFGRTSCIAPAPAPCAIVPAMQAFGKTSCTTPAPAPPPTQPLQAAANPAATAANPFGISPPDLTASQNSKGANVSCGGGPRHAQHDNVLSYRQAAPPRRGGGPDPSESNASAAAPLLPQHARTAAPLFNTSGAAPPNASAAVPSQPRHPWTAAPLSNASVAAPPYALAAALSQPQHSWTAAPLFNTS
eukprot:scaffold299339_cov18-Tisochrysis_lutea.AAC.1